MTKIKYNREYIYSLIIKLLHPFEKVDSSYLQIDQLLCNNLIKVASSHLVIPAVHAAILRKKLQSHFPRDFLTYLKQIKDLNEKRNKEIFKQIKDLNYIFTQNNIDFVFLKGAAILISKPYNSLKERMIGDIDILVSENDLSRSKKLLIKNGYKFSSDFGFTENIVKTRHLRRLTSKDFIAAVEIHRTLFDSSELNKILSSEILDKKIKTSDGYWIPNQNHLWQHAIFNWQYNDNGLMSNHINFKYILDIFHLEPKNLCLKSEKYHKSIKNLYILISLHLKRYNTGFYFIKIHYMFQLKSKLFYIIHNYFCSLVRIIPFSFSRLFLMVRSSKYRKRVINNPQNLKNKIINYWNS